MTNPNQNPWANQGPTPFDQLIQSSNALGAARTNQYTLDKQATDATAASTADLTTLAGTKKADDNAAIDGLGSSGLALGSTVMGAGLTLTGMGATAAGAAATGLTAAAIALGPVAIPVAAVILGIGAAIKLFAFFNK